MLNPIAVGFNDALTHGSYQLSYIGKLNKHRGFLG